MHRKHDPMRFEEYIPYNGPEGEGFILVQNSEYEEVYIFDDYGGWVDTDLNYYDHQGDPAGYFDTDHNFFDMKGVRIPGGYRGTKSTDKRIAEIHRYVEKVQGNDKAKFVIEFSNLPASSKPDQLAQFIMERCNVTMEMLDECKKLPKDPTKGFVVVRGGHLVYKIIRLEGRRFRMREKDGSFTSGVLQVFVKLSKFNNPIQKEKNTIITAPLEEPENGVFKIIFEGLDVKRSDADFTGWLSAQAQFRDAVVKISRQSNTGVIELEDESLKFRILKLNGRTYGDGVLRFQAIK